MLPLAYPTSPSAVVVAYGPSASVETDADELPDIGDNVVIDVDKALRVPSTLLFLVPDTAILGLLS